jgi:hypothetical protein
MDDIGWLLLSGTLLEFVGAMLVVWDIREARQTARKYFPKVKVVTAADGIQFRGESTFKIEGTAEPVQPQIIEQRVAALEDRIRLLEQRVTETDERLQEQIQNQIANETDARSRLQQQMAKEFDDVRAVVRTALGDIRARVIGFFLVVVGLACESVASTWNGAGSGWATFAAVVLAVVIGIAGLIAIGWRARSGDDG